MLTTYKQAYKTVIYAQVDDAAGKMPVGIFLDFVINPDDGTAVALWLQTLQGKKLLDPIDIVHWRSSEILIKSADNCYEAESAPRLAKIFAKECAILGANVYKKETKGLLGTVYNFGFDTISPRILSLHVRPYWWQFWGKRIIPHTRIDQITEAGIFINDQATLKKEAPLEKVSEAIHSVEERPKVDCDE
jgi:hypothetical protein